MAEYVVDGAEPNETVLRTRTLNGYEAWHWLPVHERIVRCRDCKYYTPECVSREERGYGVYEDVLEPGGCFNPERRPRGRDESGCWHVVGIDTPPDGFCAWGERREVAE